MATEGAVGELLANMNTADLHRLAAILAPAVAAAVVEHFRESADPAAREMAAAAREVPGLEPVSLYALADWLEDHALPELGAKVRRLAVKDGDLLIVQPGQPFTEAATRSLREDVARLADELEARGVKLGGVIVLPHGLNLYHVKRGASG